MTGSSCERQIVRRSECGPQRPIPIRFRSSHQKAGPRRGSLSFPLSVVFEWSPGKAASNLSKHDIAFEEAVTVFADPLARIFDDPDHSAVEDREIIVAHSAEERLLVVSFMASRRSVRILSARKATKRERRDYEENASA